MLPRPPAAASLVVDLARIVGAHGVSTNDADRFAYARDCWPRDLMRIRSGEVPAAPSCVVWPETADEVARVLALAVQLDIPIIPFGAGSGVAGGARPSDGGITLDLKRMRAIRSFDEEDLRTEVEFQTWSQEQALAERSRVAACASILAAAASEPVGAGSGPAPCFQPS